MVRARKPESACPASDACQIDRYLRGACGRSREQENDQASFQHWIRAILELALRPFLRGGEGNSSLAQTFSVEMQMRMGLAEYKVVATGNGWSLVPNANHRLSVANRRFNWPASAGAALFWSLSKQTNTSQPCFFHDLMRLAQPARASGR